MDLPDPNYDPDSSPNPNSNYNYNHNHNFIIKNDQEQREEKDERRIFSATDGVNSPYSKRNYRLAFADFIKNIIKNNDLQTLLDTKPSVIENRIIKYVEYLKDERKLVRSTIHVNCSALFNFFKMNDVLINEKKIKKFYPSDSGHYSDDRPYSIPEIQQLLDNADVRSRVIILLMASTGMRIGGLPGLRISDIRKIDEYGLYLIWVYSDSKADKYYTFCTPECAQAIDSYLEYRRRLGEEITESSSSSLIRNSMSPDNIFTAKTPKSITDKAIQLIIKDMIKKAGLTELAEYKQDKERFLKQ